VEQIPRAMEVSGSTLTTGTAAVESIVPRRMPTGPPADEERNGNPRFAERAVALPITRRSDGAPRAETPPLQAADRPVMQLLTLGLLISMIVLVSAAVGVLVGRWMTQH